MKYKKGLSLLLSGVLLAGASSYIPRHDNTAITAHATSKTADEAIAWVKSQVGKRIDMDGYPAEQPYQCVDLIKAYYQYLGVPVIPGDGWTFSYNDLPDPNWVRLEGVHPQKGDILVYGPSSDNEYGHVGIYESDFSTYHQNVSGAYVANITEWAYNGFTNPYWGVIRPNWSNVIIGQEMTTGAGQTIPDGDYSIASKVGSGFFVDPAPGYDVPAASGSNVAITDNAGALPDACDSFTFTYLDNGFYKITQAGTDMCLDVTGASMECGTNVQLYPWWGSPAQMWSVEKTEWGFAFRSKQNSFVLDVTGSKAVNNTNVEVWQWNGTKGQLYSLIPYSKTRFKGSGTAKAPYQISSAEDLRMLSKYMGNELSQEFYGDKYYIQTTDIDLKKESFIPIGRADDKTGYVFRGHYNGNNKTIKNLNIDCDYNYSGLFGAIYDGASIENLVVYGKVNCPTHHHVGGIAAELGNLSSVKNCAFIGDVISDSKTGGIAGTVFMGGSIENCYFIGNVQSISAPQYTGGILSYALIGNPEGTASLNVNNCYSAVSSTVNGGIVGEVKYGDKGSINVNNNYYLKTSADAGITGEYTKGCTGVSEELMKTTISELLGEPYINNTSTSLNDGYPIFAWQNMPKGDCNGDGSFNIADAVLLQKWLLAVPDTHIADWKAADMYEDNKLDVSDLCMMKRKLINS